MQIDWITVAAQIANFLVLVWLLHRFLYSPITDAMERREKAIQSRLDEAKAEKEKAEKRSRDLEKEKQRLDERRHQILNEVRAEADDLRKRLEKEARNDIDEKRRAWRDQIRADRAAFLDNLRDQSVVAWRELASDALHDLADTSLNEKLVDRFLERMKSLDDGSLAELKRSAQTNEGVIVEAVDELDAGVRRRLTKAIHDLVGKDVDVAYKIRADLGAGLRLRTPGQKIEWSFDDYLDRYIDRLRRAFPPDTDTKGQHRTGNEADAERANG